MTSRHNLSADVVIFGGGVAGLWLLARLRQANFNAILVESNALGAGQTRFAQGIIHGGTKYALTGKLTASSEAVTKMPSIWRDCLHGTGEIDLTQVKVLSQHQYMWSTTSLTSRMAGFFASQVMRSRTKALSQSERPVVFQDSAFKGQVYRLDEPVLDVASVIHSLATPHLDAIMHASVDSLVLDEQNHWQIRLQASDATSWLLNTRRVVLAAGKGNATILASMDREQPAMQLRPLRMVMLRGALPEMLYAHCMAASVNPRITITSHRDAQGEIVWYLGGQLAEDGVKRSDEQQLKVAQNELAALLPWLDLSNTQWATLYIERAEPKQADGKRPDTSFVAEENGVLTSWPTKMALSPNLASDVLQHLETAGLSASGVSELPSWPQPAFANLPWLEEERWN